MGAVLDRIGARTFPTTRRTPAGRFRGLPGQAPQHRQAPGGPGCRHLLGDGAGRAGRDRVPDLPPPRGQHHRVAGVRADHPSRGPRRSRSRGRRSRSTSSSSAPTAARARPTCWARPRGCPTPRSCSTSPPTASRAYGVSIPRDLMVPRPDCKGRTGEHGPGAADRPVERRLRVGGEACTVAQFEEMSDLRVNHVVIVNFNGFEDMVDALGGVPICVPDRGQRPDRQDLPLRRQLRRWTASRPSTTSGSATPSAPRTPATSVACTASRRSWPRWSTRRSRPGTLFNPVRLVRFLNAGDQVAHHRPGAAPSSATCSHPGPGGAGDRPRQGAVPQRAVRALRARPEPARARSRPPTSSGRSCARTSR